MGASDIASLIKEYGLGVGVMAIALFVCGVLFKMLMGSWEARIADAKLASEALTRQASTNAEISSSMRDLREGQTEIMRVVSLTERDVENGDKGVQEKLKDLSDTITEMSRRIDQACRGGTR